MSEQQKHIVILGGGIGGMKVYKLLNSRLCSGKKCKARITVVNNTNYFTYVPMLHEAATGGVEDSHVVTPLREIVDIKKHAVKVATITGIDTKHNNILTDKGNIHFDYAVIALGSRVNYFKTPGAQEHSFAIRTYEDAQRLRSHLNSKIEDAEADGKDMTRHIAIVGGGAVGVEVAGQLSVLLDDVGKLYPKLKRNSFLVTLIHSGDRLLPALDPTLSQWALRRLKKLGVRVLFEKRVTEVTGNAVLLDDGSRIKTCTTIWAAGAVPNTLGTMAADLLDEKGYVVVDTTMSVGGHRHIFALGDVAQMYWQGKPVGVPMLAEAAHDGAFTVAKNIERALSGTKEYKTFEYHSKGSLIPIGDWFGIAHVYHIRFKGRFAWWLRRTVYLIFMYNWRDRMRIAFDWTLDIFGVRDTTRQ